jgi:multidrug efflux pump subunit AcrA (membrane-fusion protein)
VLELLGVDPSVAARPSRDTGSSSTVWIVEGASIRPVRVRTGISDTTSTEILEGSLEQGARVVTRLGATASQPTASSATRSPLIQGPPGPPPPR